MSQDMKSYKQIITSLLESIFQSKVLSIFHIMCVVRKAMLTM